MMRHGERRSYGSRGRFGMTQMGSGGRVCRIDKEGVEEPADLEAQRLAILYADIEDLKRQRDILAAAIRAALIVGGRTMSNAQKLKDALREAGMEAKKGGE